MVVTLSAAVPSEAQVPALGACERPHETPPGAPVNVDLARVTDTEFAVTWLTCRSGAPSPEDAVVTYAEAGSAAAKSVAGPKTAFHNVRVTGLKPGTSYRYTVTSSGVTAPPDRFNPGSFTTLVPPAGKEIARIAVLADIHIGEDVSGLGYSGPPELPPGYRHEEPYATRMLEGAVEMLNREKTDLVILPADNSSHGELHDLADAKAVLDRLNARYSIARGAHDRPAQYDAAEQECPPDGDCFRQVFYPRDAPGPSLHARRVKGWTVIALDSADPSTGQGRLDSEQLAWLEDQLRRAEKKSSPVLVFFHHPVAEYSTTMAVPPAVFGVNQPDAQRFLELIGRYDVRLVVNSHTHRNWIAYSPHTGRMPIIETGPVKEYPGGITVIRIFEGGFIREWLPIDCDFCNMWRETTRGEYFSLYPLYTLGSVRDRSFVHRFDSPDVPGVPSLPLGLWPPLVPGEA